ncbi:hypothetical protein, partial [Klebsiella pneumoniae]|uniref:hypothetical protein n=1 Tax=Klebsiella pneumoniae TaxID=573 RepID=UPI00210BB5FC
TKKIDDHGIGDLKEFAKRYPSTELLYRYAQLSIEKNNRNEAKWALQTICNVRTKQTCITVIDAWRTQFHKESQEDVIPIAPPSKK